jgi:hypothetical protein
MKGISLQLHKFIDKNAKEGVPGHQEVKQRPEVASPVLHGCPCKSEAVTGS